MSDFVCKYRNNILCGLSGDACLKCGWNPVVEADRIHNIETGKVKTYLKINFKLLGAEWQRGYREREKDG